MSGHLTSIPEDCKVRIPSDSKWAGYPKLAAGVGGAALLAAFLLSKSQGEHRFEFAYLTAYMFVLSIAIGGLFFVIIQHLVRAGWSVVVRRIAENVMGTLPLFAVLFIPIAFGLHHTHHHWWDVPVGQDAIIDGKRAYLNHGFFYFRAIVYLAVWSGLAWWFLKTSTKQDETGDHDLTRKMQGMAPVGIILFALTVTFAAIDWIKTMDPHWYSTMWGVYYFAGSLVAIFSTLALMVLWLQKDGFVKDVISVEHRHDIGKLLFGFNVFWTYIAFSQYFLIWYANIPEEHLFFYHRSMHGWETLGKMLIVGHFFIPFFFLISRATKRNRVTLGVAAVWMLCIQYLDIYYLVMPMAPGGSEHGVAHAAEGGGHAEAAHFALSAIDILALVGVLGLFFAAFSYLMARSNLVPIRDPRLPESLRFENF